MSRTLLDDDLLTWEVYATSGDYGFADRDSRIVFHCLTDPRRRARSVRIAGPQAEAERTVEDGGDVELMELLGKASPLD
jgi:hypothetical protein